MALPNKAGRSRAIFCQVDLWRGSAPAGGEGWGGAGERGEEQDAGRNLLLNL